MAVRNAGAPAIGSRLGSQSETLSLWDWRRRIADLYGQVRSLPGREGWELWRTARDELFRSHPQSPLAGHSPDAFAGLPLFPYAPELRFAVATEPVGGAAAIRVEVGGDGALAFTPFARTTGLADVLGGELTLYWIGGYGGGVFLPFRDATGGTETYGGGRYLLDTIKSADLGQDRDGRILLDFNFAYNPSCAYSDRWVCPLSPPENTLSHAVRAGEKAPAFPA